MSDVMTCHHVTRCLVSSFTSDIAYKHSPCSEQCQVCCIQFANALFFFSETSRVGKAWWTLRCVMSSLRWSLAGCEPRHYPPVSPVFHFIPDTQLEVSLLPRHSPQIFPSWRQKLVSLRRERRTEGDSLSPRFMNGLCVYMFDIGEDLLTYYINITGRKISTLARERRLLNIKQSLAGTRWREAAGWPLQLLLRVEFYCCPLFSQICHRHPRAKSRIYQNLFHLPRPGLFLTMTFDLTWEKFLKLKMKLQLSLVAGNLTQILGNMTLSIFKICFQ